MKTTFPLKLAVPLTVAALGAGTSILVAQSGPIQSAAWDPALNDVLPRSGHSAQLSKPSPKAVELAEVVVRLRPGADIKAIARDARLTVVRRSLVSDGWVLGATTVQKAREGLARIQRRQEVLEAFLNRRLVTAPRAFEPNDPYFQSDTPEGGPNGGWPGQFYLANSAVEGLDVNVKPLWDEDLTGNGVLIGIVDDGLDVAHPDLSPNHSAADSIDVASRSLDPSPRLAADNHGTFVAGSAVARGGNGIGITGAAPLAKFAGIRVPLNANTFTDELDVAAIEHRSIGAGARIKIKNHSYGNKTPFIESDPSLAALDRSTAAGTIHVYAAGNDRGKMNQDTNKDPSMTHPGVIVVAALNSAGKFTSYSSFGANVTTTALGGDDAPLFGHLSTDRRTVGLGYSAEAAHFFPDGQGNYAANLQGTSFTAPVVTGLLAVAKQARPGLNARWTKHLLARTSIKIDPNDNSPFGRWTENAAGFNFNPNYGFGLIDAAEFVAAARASSGVTPLVTQTVGPVTVRATVPDNNVITRTFSVSRTTPLEEVQVSLDIAHRRRGQLEAYLVSPSGTRSRLFLRSTSDLDQDVQWTFLSNAFWGENPAGTWRLEVRDTVAGVVGTWNSFRVVLRMGNLIEVNP